MMLVKSEAVFIADVQITDMDSIKRYTKHFNCHGFRLYKYPLALGESLWYVTTIQPIESFSASL